MKKKELLKRLKAEREDLELQRMVLSAAKKRCAPGSDDSQSILVELKEIRLMTSSIDEEIIKIKTETRSTLTDICKSLAAPMISGAFIIGQTLILLVAEDKIGALTSFASKKMQTPKM